MTGKKRHLVLVLVLVAGISASYAQKKKNNDSDESKIRVKEYQADSLQNVVQTYAIQKSVLRLKVQVQRSSFVPGPYAEFAEKYLGAVAKVKAEDVYRIKEARLDVFSENDPKQMYAIRMEGNAEFNTEAFKRYFADPTALLPAQHLTGDPLPCVLSAVQFLDRGVDATTYDKSGGGAALPLIPVIADKTPDRRAKDAADYILLLRKRRTELIGADVEAAFASSEAIQHALTEIKRMEELYLALFYGVNEAPRVITQTYLVDPEAGKEEYPLGIFFADKGLLPLTAAAKTGLAVNLRIVPDVKQKSMQAVSAHALPYRAPMGCSVQLSLGSDVILLDRAQILQFGPVMYLPGSLFVQPSK